MTTKKALEILKYHNAWRRGGEEEYKYTAAELGEAMDLAIAHLYWIEQNSELFGTVSTTNDENSNYGKVDRP